MLDNSCKDAQLDARPLPALKDGHLSARCVCGAVRRVPTASITSTPPCTSCGEGTAEGLLHGPDRLGITRMLDRYQGPSDQHNVVYFARIAGVVKIGTTSDIRTRWQSLGSPEILGVMDGGFKVKKATHRLFSHLHLHGEVFQIHADLLAYVAQHCRAVDVSNPEPPAPRLHPPHMPYWMRRL